MTPSKMPKGVAYPAPVIGLLYGEHPQEYAASLERSMAARDDAFWAAFVRLPFTWQRYLTWWAARRYVEPRDYHKEWK